MASLGFWEKHHILKRVKFFKIEQQNKELLNNDRKTWNITHRVVVA